MRWHGLKRCGNSTRYSRSSPNFGSAASRLEIVCHTPAFAPPCPVLSMNLRFTPSAVSITPTEKLVTLVPADAALKIERKLSSTEIDQVVVGQPAKRRFYSFNQRTTPELCGSVNYVSAATSSDPLTGQVHCLADVIVPSDELEKLGNNRLLPGMPIEVLSTEERTALSYLPKPLGDQFNCAFSKH